MIVLVNIADDFRLEIMSYCTVILKKTQAGAKKNKSICSNQKKEN